MKYTIILYFALVISFMSCSHDLMQMDNDAGAIDIFDEFWTYVDEHYIYFDLKEVDWDDVYKRSRAELYDGMSADEVFVLCNKALLELKDTHCRLESSERKGVNYDFTQAYDIHFSLKKVNEVYANRSLEQSGFIFHAILPNDIGYIYIAGMQTSIVRSMYAQGAKGLIIDVRNNGGGDSNPVIEIASDFIRQPTTLGYYVEKSGPGHNEMTSPIEIKAHPSPDFYFDRPVAVLINRRSYSAATYLASMFQEIPGVSLVGQITGGGGGGNFGYQLSNEWIVAVSVSDFLNSDFRSVEFGVVPDIKIENTEERLANGVDDMLDTAMAYLTEQM